MALSPVVMKFGGTSVENADAFRRVARIVASQVEQHPVVVVSAMSGVTNALLGSVEAASAGDADAGINSLEQHFARHAHVAQALLAENDVREFEELLDRARSEIAELLSTCSRETINYPGLQDAVVSYGEQLSSALLAKVLKTEALSAKCVDSRKCIITDDEHGRATPLQPLTTERTRAELNPLLEAGEVPVLGGFIAASRSGATTTLGRGGSDYTAAIIAAPLDAREIQIWTDVSGVLTADPRVVPSARTIPGLSYSEAAELAYFGAKVLHPKTIQPAVEKNIPVRICNSARPEDAGTLVIAESDSAPRTVKAIAHKTNVTTLQITSARMLGAYGFLRAIFEIFDKYRTAVDVVTTSEVSVSLSLDDTSALNEIVEELRRIGDVSIERGRAIVCVVGEGLRDTAGIAGQIFSKLNDINISLISLGASRINLTFTVDEPHSVEVVRRLHREFFE